MQFTIVKAVPLASAFAFRAMRVENSGESATTTIPQNTRNTIKIKMESSINISGEKRQHMHERNRAAKAVFFAPIFKDIIPPIIQDIPPIPIIIKDNKGIFSKMFGCKSLYVPIIKGIKAQKAYNSHICPK
jgi:hypothetical protein